MVRLTQDVPPEDRDRALVRPGRAGLPAPFRLQPPHRRPVKRALLRVMRPGVERLLAFPALNQLYQRVHPCDDPKRFLDKTLEKMNVHIRVRDQDLAKIPETGPLVVVANHPFGGIEGIVLAQLLLRVRPDAKLMANYLLHSIPELHDLFFFVDPFDKPGSAKRNLASMKGSVRWVREGHVLGIFPAGEVSHLTWTKRVVSDPTWSDTVARIIKRTDASVLPIFFDGRNSDLFQAAGLLHPRLRTALLPREFLARQGRNIRLHVGKVIPAAKLRSFEDPQEMTAYLRMRTYILRNRTHRSSRERGQNGHRRHAHTQRHEEPIIPPVPTELLQADVDAIPEAQKLVKSGHMQVIYGSAGQLPNVLREIGRLREATFRPVGEGTGRGIDLDRFDETYLHLFIWHTQRNEVVGAYRMGQTDVILPREGKDGLYTYTLFNYKRGLLEQISPALEMGRSFVRSEYQREYAPLMILWKGIGHYVVANPRYRYLLGPVSISNTYKSISKYLLFGFLRVHRQMDDLAKLIRPKNPPRFKKDRRWDSRVKGKVVRHFDEGSINDLIAELESDGKPMPVLLRQYLKLNGKLLGFNVDPDFGDVLDGLLLVDLTEVDRGVLNRYMSKDGADQFLGRYERGGA